MEHAMFWDSLIHTQAVLAVNCLDSGVDGNRSCKRRSRDGGTWMLGVMCKFRHSPHVAANSFIRGGHIKHWQSTCTDCEVPWAW